MPAGAACAGQGHGVVQLAAEAERQTVLGVGVVAVGGQAERLAERHADRGIAGAVRAGQVLVDPEALEGLAAILERAGQHVAGGVGGGFVGEGAGGLDIDRVDPVGGVGRVAGVADTDVALGDVAADRAVGVAIVAVVGGDGCGGAVHFAKAGGQDAGVDADAEAGLAGGADVVLRGGDELVDVIDDDDAPGGAVGGGGHHFCGGGGAEAERIADAGGQGVRRGALVGAGLDDGDSLGAGEGRRGSEFGDFLVGHRLGLQADVFGVARVVGAGLKEQGITRFQK